MSDKKEIKYGKIYKDINSEDLVIPLRLTKHDTVEVTLVHKEHTGFIMRAGFIGQYRLCE